MPLTLSALKQLRQWKSNTYHDPTMKIKDYSHTIKFYGKRFQTSQPIHNLAQIRSAEDLVIGGVYKLKKFGYYGQTTMTVFYKGINEGGNLVFSGFNFVINISPTDICLEPCANGLWTRWSWTEGIFP